MKKSGFDLATFFRQGIKRRIIPRRMSELLLHYCNLLIPALLIFAFLLIMYDLGFQTFRGVNTYLNRGLKILLIGLSILMGLRFFMELFSVKKLKARIFNLVVWMIVLFTLAKVMDLQAEGLLVDTNRFLLNKYPGHSCFLYRNIFYPATDLPAWIKSLFVIYHKLRHFYIGGYNYAVLS